jgi:hypothetical protein
MNEPEENEESYRERERDHELKSFENPCFAPWRVEQNGDYTCARCGSWHPLQLREWLPKVDGLENSVEMADGATKVYVDRPGVRNATEGAIKFYLYHMPKGEERAAFSGEILKALTLSNAYRKLKYGGGAKA